MDKMTKTLYDIREKELLESGIEFPDFGNWPLYKIFDFLKKWLANSSASEKETLNFILAREFCEIVQMAKLAFSEGTLPDEPRRSARKPTSA